jgi:uncharacterized membrane protein YhaH (DUF805 family)
LPDRDQLFWLFFRFSGRVSRAAYFLAGLLLAIVEHRARTRLIAWADLIGHGKAPDPARPARFAGRGR